MLFNSLEFIGVFLPVSLAGYFLLGAFGRRRLVIAWLVLTSLFFYGWWNPAYLWVIIASILGNYACGMILLRYGSFGRMTLTFGIAANLAVLGYFKYANFFFDSLYSLTHAEFAVVSVALPLGISFFTFQQIAYLIDMHRRKVSSTGFLEYCLFVTFFPQLIAGPIVHHGDMLPQFYDTSLFRAQSRNIAIGLTIFMIGLCKKTVFADTVSLFSTPVFLAAEQGIALNLFDSWIGALSYTLQLYFDFSGYSDMAIGSARMFGILLPLNFFSPYKAVSIIDFWRRWHITLSNFLRDYVYIPLGGSRRGFSALCLNVFVTMLLGGLWHGAGWTFVFWGGLHGAYLVINHTWRRVSPFGKTSSFLGRLLSWFVTFLAVVVSWVFFRAHTFAAALSMLRGMIGMNGVPHALTDFVIIDAYSWKTAVCVVIVLLLVAWFAPNTEEYMSGYAPSLFAQETKPAWKIFRWEPTTVHAAVLTCITVAACTFLIFSKKSEFLYFQF